MTANDFLKKWLEDLRSGQFKQGKKYLFDGVGYCCLGLACVSAGMEGMEIDHERRSFGQRHSVYDLPLEMQELLGCISGPEVPLADLTDEDRGVIMSELKTRNIEYTVLPNGAVTLITLNDCFHWNFVQIADFIEKYKCQLFSKVTE